VRAYREIRAHCEPERVAVVFHDGFRSHREYLGFMQPPAFRNVLFDVHRYQCFEPADVALDVDGHVHKAGIVWKREADEIQRELALPAIVGEWSLGLVPEPVAYDGSAAEQAKHAPTRPRSSRRSSATTAGSSGATAPSRAGLVLPCDVGAAGCRRAS
jgi:hypothetical protein